ETVLMNLLRGTGTRGLRGLQPVSRRQSSGEILTIIRPLWEFTRKETAIYCREHKLEPRLDASNLSEEPFRNRVRHRLLPALEEYNPQVIESLLRTARIAADDIDYIDGEVERLRNTVTHAEKGMVVIDKEAFAALPAALKRHLLRAVVLSLRGTLKDIEAGHIEDILDALAKPAGKVIGLPDGLNFTIEYDRYVVAPDSAALCPLPGLEDEHHLKVPGTTSLPGWEITATVHPASRAGDTSDTTGGFTARFDYAATGSNLTVRARRPGDRFRPLGMERSKKLNQFMIDARIPRTWRRCVPVVASPEHILWVAGWRIDDRAKVTGATGEVLCLRFTRV
ncbi:MAG: tRNA lysidine(34) synthetase TilS, partial [Dehalococcoidales bacterium]|nr:tRNA lysidine(34) synthetase TilS [Dehalococcoidales bacterium]